MLSPKSLSLPWSVNNDILMKKYLENVKNCLCFHKKETRACGDGETWGTGHITPIFVLDQGKHLNVSLSLCPPPDFARNKKTSMKIL